MIFLNCLLGLVVTLKPLNNASLSLLKLFILAICSTRRAFLCRSSSPSFWIWSSHSETVHKDQRRTDSKVSCSLLTAVWSCRQCLDVTRVLCFRGLLDFSVHIRELILLQEQAHVTARSTLLEMSSSLYGGCVTQYFSSGVHCCFCFLACWTIAVLWDARLWDWKMSLASSIWCGQFLVQTYVFIFYPVLASLCSKRVVCGNWMLFDKVKTRTKCAVRKASGLNHDFYFIYMHLHNLI